MYNFIFILKILIVTAKLSTIIFNLDKNIFKNEYE